MTLADIKQKVESALKAAVESNPKVPSAFLLVHAESLGVHWTMAQGQSRGEAVAPDQPFHTASIGKSFTAVLIAMLAEAGKLRFDDPIAAYLPDDLMEGLHVYKGRDYSREIRLSHLLSHTSGLADFFEDKPKDGKSFTQRILEEPERIWTPQETVEWTKRHLKPRFAPGKRAHYTDTGFNLLGLIIEAVTGKPYHDVLHADLFDRLGMKQSYLSQYASPAEPSPHAVAEIYALDRIVRVEEQKSFSSFYASGQTVSTGPDLLIFMKALVEGRLLKPETLAEMQRWTKLWVGVDYGYGLHRVRMLPLVPTYRAWGHLGSIGAFMLYNPALDVYVIGNFNSTAYIGQSIRFAFGVLRRLAKPVRKQARVGAMAAGGKPS